MSKLGDLVSDTGRKTAIFIITGVLFGATLGFLAAQNQQISKQQASQKLVSTLEAQSGEQLEVVNVKRENGLYKIDVSNSQDQLSTYHMTQDGRLISSEMSNLDQLRQRIAVQQQVTSCLSNQGAVLYGNSSQRATLAQIQTLGGVNMVSAIYKDVNTQGVLQEAAQRGITRVPSIYYNGSTISGVNSINQISEFTGCQLGR